MPAELLRFPVKALKVKVGGFKPPRIQPTGSVLPYAPEWTVEALKRMLEQLHGQVTASVVVSSLSYSTMMLCQCYNAVMLILQSGNVTV